MSRPHPPEVREQALRLYREGRTLSEVCGLLRISRETVARWVRDAGISRRCGPVGIDNSEGALTNGRWVGRRGVMRWVAD